MEQDENLCLNTEELETIYHYPIKYIEMVCEKNSRGLLLYGKSSLGKSFRVKEVLTRLGRKDYCFISGHVTPMKFYKKLYENRNGLIIFDDCNILESIIILNMVKASLNENSSNVVEYHTTKKMDVPSSFVFNGQVIILLNDIPKKSEHLNAITSRIITCHLKFGYDEIIKIIFKIAQENKIEGTTLAERLEVANWIKQNTNEATQNLNIRLFLQAIEFFKWDKVEWKALAMKQIQNDEKVQLVIQNCSDKEWVDKTGTGLKQKQRLRAKLGLTRSYTK